MCLGGGGGGGGHVYMNTWHYCADCGCEGVCLYICIYTCVSTRHYMSVCTISMEQFFAILYVCVYAND